MSDTIEFSFRSEALDWIRYSKLTQQLEVRFRSGGVYNAYQILLTLLHELAHAKTRAIYGRAVAPHGAEWKRTFSELLLDFLGRELFPREIAPQVRRHAANPRYTDDNDCGLQFVLRAYDTLDRRQTVAELATGQTFSLDGKLMLIKRSDGTKNYFNCVTLNGRIFRVHATARVHSLFESQEAIGNKPN